MPQRSRTQSVNMSSSANTNHTQLIHRRTYKHRSFELSTREDRRYPTPSPCFCGDWSCDNSVQKCHNGINTFATSKLNWPTWTLQALPALEETMNKDKHSWSWPGQHAACCPWRVWLGLWLRILTVDGGALPSAKFSQFISICVSFCVQQHGVHDYFFFIIFSH